MALLAATLARFLYMWGVGILSLLQIYAIVVALEALRSRSTLLA